MSLAGMWLRRRARPASGASLQRTERKMTSRLISGILLPFPLSLPWLSSDSLPPCPCAWQYGVQRGVCTP